MKPLHFIIAFFLFFSFASATEEHWDISPPITCSDNLHFLTVVTAKIENVQSFVLDDSTLLLLSSNGTVTPYDVRNHSFPKKLEPLAFSEPIIAIFSDEHYFYFLTENQKIIIYSKTLSHIDTIEIDTTQISKIFPFDNKIYLLERSKGITTYDLLTSQTTSHTFPFADSEIIDLAIAGERIFALDPKHGVLALDTNLSLVAKVPLDDEHFQFPYSNRPKALLALPYGPQPSQQESSDTPYANILMFRERTIHGYTFVKDYNETVSDYIHPKGMGTLKGTFRNATIDRKSGNLYVATDFAVERFSISDMGWIPANHPFIMIAQEPRRLAIQSPYLYILDDSTLLITKSYFKSFPDPTCSDRPFYIPHPTSPPPLFLKKLVHRTLKPAGYFYHYGKGAFDWLYFSASKKIVAKLQGASPDGTLRWQNVTSMIGSIQIEKNASKQVTTITLDTIDPNAPEYLKKLGGTPFVVDGYFFHYSNGAFDWIYLAKEFSLLAKLEGMDEAGFLQWKSFQDNIEFDFDQTELRLGDAITKIHVQ